MKIEIEIPDEAITVIVNTINEQGIDVHSIDVREAIKAFIQESTDEAKWEIVDSVIDQLIEERA